MIEEVIYAPVNRFLILLAQGWRLQFIVQPMSDHHGQYAVLLWRPVRD